MPRKSKLQAISEYQQEMQQICELCRRPLAAPITKHHLHPLSKGGKGTPTIPLHKICHDIIHRLFTEKELLKSYNTMEKLRDAPELQEFIAWVQKKEPEYFAISARAKRKGT